MSLGCTLAPSIRILADDAYTNATVRKRTDSSVAADIRDAERVFLPSEPKEIASPPPVVDRRVVPQASSSVDSQRNLRSEEIANERTPIPRTATTADALGECLDSTEVPVASVTRVSPVPSVARLAPVASVAMLAPPMVRDIRTGIKLDPKPRLTRGSD